MKIAVYNQEGKELSQVLLPKDIFDVKANPDLIHQVAVSQMANRREVIAHTKMRSEVSGAGK
ncbi:MAG: 50S ribosomal protein L4, partial [Candidatus Pacebacteria bacterium]|nr:50S ribosomal protein L4 [Candidatus Paceibacterota bacterium]